MRLDQLLSDIDLERAGALEVVTVEIDSRRCVPGSLFFAMPGATTDGQRFIGEARSRGAVAVVAPVEVDIDIPVIVVAPEHLHALMVAASSRIVADPQHDVKLLGVTGTNGKTSVATLVSEIWSRLGRESAVVGTLTHERTTPAPPELFRALASLRDRPGAPDERLLALEVSSHALEQGRVDGIVFDVAVFTNLSHDHLDYHGTMERYFAAKSTLFEAARSRRHVIWANDPYGRRLLEMHADAVAVRAQDARDVTYGIGATSFLWRGHQVVTRLSGEYNLDNTLLALTACVELGASVADACDAISSVAPIDGRFDVVATQPTVVVDYAHTPDGLERLLRDVRALAASSRIIVVFGCGGDRDAAKRPVMGAVAAQYADVAIVTSDNPRSEDPERIIDEIISGARGAPMMREPDRRRAISSALRMAGSSDVVVVAGKGHEHTQTIGDQVLDFNDREVVKELLEDGSC